MNDEEKRRLELIHCINNLATDLYHRDKELNACSVALQIAGYAEELAIQQTIKMIGSWF